MSEALVVSNVLLWILVVVLALVVAALTRQVGLLHERVAPAGALAMAQGPEVGEKAPEFTLSSLDGRSLQLGGSDEAGGSTLLFFLSPTCPVCEGLLPTIRRIVSEHPTPVRVVYASDGGPEEHAALRREHGLEQSDYVLSTELGMRYQVAKLPWAVLIGADGRVRAKGLVNTREHLESLFEADRLGVASLQEYLQRKQRAADSARNRAEGSR